MVYKIGTNSRKVSFMKKLFLLALALCFLSTAADARLISDARYESGTVLSGQTSIAVTIPGITTNSKCLASFNEIATNAITLRAVVATANTVTVTVSGDPGASNQDLTIWCAN